MKHPYRIREIAVQAGLSGATVDRVLHGRAGVRDSTVREVQQATGKPAPPPPTTPAHRPARACLAVMQAQGALSGPVRTDPSGIQVITPHNAPPVEF